MGMPKKYNSNLEIDLEIDLENVNLKKVVRNLIESPT